MPQNTALTAMLAVSTAPRVLKQLMRDCLTTGMPIPRTLSQNDSGSRTLGNCE
jgi:hypothetical protein